MTDTSTSQNIDISSWDILCTLKVSTHAIISQEDKDPDKSFASHGEGLEINSSC
jgi:hypothetical protein